MAARTHTHSDRPRADDRADQPDPLRRRAAADYRAARARLCSRRRAPANVCAARDGAARDAHALPAHLRGGQHAAHGNRGGAGGARAAGDSRQRDAPDPGASGARARQLAPPSPPTLRCTVRTPIGCTRFFCREAPRAARRKAAAASERRAPPLL
eukprot:3165904-Prymnesium_polylepis.1